MILVCIEPIQIEIHKSARFYLDSSWYLVRAMCAVNCSAKSTPPITLKIIEHTLSSHGLGKYLEMVDFVEARTDILPLHKRGKAVPQQSIAPRSKSCCQTEKQEGADV